jgi:hypothetical protein
MWVWRESMWIRMQTNDSLFWAYEFDECWDYPDGQVTLIFRREPLLYIVT